MMSSLVRACVSHAIAAGVVVASTGILTLALFVVLFFVAIVTNAPLGGRLAVPFWTLTAMAASAAAVLLCFLPATVLAAALARAFRLPVLIEISLATLFLLLMTSAWGCLMGAGVGSVSAGLQQGALVGGVLLLPFGLYGWSVRSTSWLVSASQRFGLKTAVIARSLPKS